MSTKSPAALGASRAALFKRRKLTLKAKLESRTTYASFKSYVPGGFNLGLLGSTCTALPCPAQLGPAAPQGLPDVCSPRHRHALCTKSGCLSYVATHQPMRWRGAYGGQSDKIPHIDMGDDHIDTVISHIIFPYPISTSRMTISIWWITISIYHICTIYHIDNPHPISKSLSISH